MSEQIALNLEREGIKIASMQKRIFAYLIDEFVLAALFMVIYYDNFANLSTNDEMMAAVTALSWQYVMLRTIYHTFFTWYSGATLGKVVLKIVCIDVGYLDKPSFGASLIRAVVRNISEGAFYLGYLWALGSPIRQTWHDRLAKTVVIDVA